jgi:hypothetical protein
MELRISTEVHPTEDPKKVRDAVLNIFPSAKLEMIEDRFEGRSGEAIEFLTLLRDQYIRDTAVSVMNNGLSGDETRFHLNKQVAAVGKVNFTDGSSSLGDIEVVVLSGALELIAEATPPKDTVVQHYLNTHHSNVGEDEL